MADAVEGVIRMIIDLSFIFIVLIAVLSQSQTTSDAHAQWRRIRPRSNDSQNAVKVKRQAMGNAAGGVQVAMSAPAGPSGMTGMTGMSGMSGPAGSFGMGGSPQFMGPHGIHHEFSCIGRLPRLYQDPWQCNRYYWCNYGSPPVPFSCPGGQLFDQELQTCTMALAVECRDFPEPLDALDMPAGGIGYPGHFGGMNGSPYSQGGGMGMGSMGAVSSAGGLGPSVSGPMVVNNGMPPAGPPPGAVMSVPATLPAATGMSGGAMNGVAMSSPMNTAPVGSGVAGSGAGMAMQASNIMPNMNNINNIQAQAVQQAQAASLQGGGGMMSNNINLNQFANALLSAGHSQSHNGATSNSINNSGGGPDNSVACDSGKLGLFADTGKNCRTYFFCSPGGTKYEFQCPPHLLFSDRMKTCDSPENVVCDTPAPSFTGSNSNQVVNGFAVNSPSRGLGFAGVVSAPDEAMPLRFPFHTMNHLNNNNNMYAMQSAKRQQAMGGGMQPDFMQASSNSYPNYAMQQGNSAQSPPQPPYNPYGTRNMGSGPTAISGMNPYSIHPMYGQAPFSTGGASQLPHHLAQRSMQPAMPAANNLPQYNPSGGVYPTYQTQPEAVYPMQGPPPPVYPSPVYSRQPMNPAAEPQMEGGAANYPAHLPSPTYYPMPVGIAAPPHHQQPTYQMAPGGPPHYAARPGGPQHGPHSSMPGQMGPHGPRGVKMPIYDPEAEVEAGRGPEPGAAGAAAAGAAGAGAGPGPAAGLNSFPGGQPNQAQVGPMVMHPDVVMVQGTYHPEQEVVLGTTTTTQTSQSTSSSYTLGISTSATIRPMSPDIVLPLHSDDSGGLKGVPPTQQSAFPTKASSTSVSSSITVSLPKNQVIISTS